MWGSAYGCGGSTAVAGKKGSTRCRGGVEGPRGAHGSDRSDLDEWRGWVETSPHYPEAPWLPAFSRTDDYVTIACTVSWRRHVVHA